MTVESESHIGVGIIDIFGTLYFFDSLEQFWLDFLCIPDCFPFVEYDFSSGASLGSMSCTPPILKVFKVNLSIAIGIELILGFLAFLLAQHVASFVDNASHVFQLHFVVFLVLKLIKSLLECLDLLRVSVD